MVEKEKFKYVDLVVNEEDKRALIPGDSVILLLYARTGYAIRGRTVFHKELFLMYKEILNRKEFQRLNIVDPLFVPYRYGPFSFKLSSAIASLVFAGKIRKTGRRGSEKFSITEDGMKLAGNVLQFLPQGIGSELLEILREKRVSWDQLSGRGLTNRTLMLFPEYFVFAFVRKANLKSLRAIELSQDLSPEVRVIIKNVNSKIIAEKAADEEYYKELEQKFGGEIWAELYAELN
ncbi:MAG: hypothetical protein QXU18_05380 [Thermoplasmatales archaeon]